MYHPIHAWGTFQHPSNMNASSPTTDVKNLSPRVDPSSCRRHTSSLVIVAAIIRRVTHRSSTPSFEIFAAAVDPAFSFFLLPWDGKKKGRNVTGCCRPYHSAPWDPRDVSLHRHHHQQQQQQL
jgi:hypothetical protein